MHVVFPVYAGTKLIEEEFEKEYKLVLSLNEHTYSLVDIDTKKVIVDNTNGEKALYRGWMLSKEDYQWLSSKFNLETSLENYLKFHEIKHWYPLIKEYTFDTEIFNDKVDFISNFNQKYDKYIVKNYVKSLGFASSKEEILNLIDTSIQNNFDGIVVRKFEELDKNEKRVFVYKKQLVTLHRVLPLWIFDVIKILDSDILYCIDLVMTKDKEWKVVEIGDGQVSSLKEHETHLDGFYNVLNYLNTKG